MSISDDLSVLASASMLVDTNNGIGSGTLIAHSSRNSFIITCAHVIKDATELSVTYREGKKFIKLPCSVEAQDEEHDLALLRTVKKIKKHNPLSIASSEPEIYAQVYLMGAPEGYLGTGAQGILTSKDGSNGSKEDDHWQITGFVTAGLSGGTVANLDCELIGVIAAVARDGNLQVWPIGFAIPLVHVNTFITKSLKDRLANKTTK